MPRMPLRVLSSLLVAAALGAGSFAQVSIVPTEVQMPGTQALEVGTPQSVSHCDNCHGDYDPAVEPMHNWSGSMMAHAGRDAIYWAATAVAEQDFPGAGDLCIRCHSPRGWYDGHSTPTDGSALVASDGEGVECDVCHTMTNPDRSEHLGTQFAPFLAHDGGTPPKGHYGNGQLVLWDGQAKLGPYANATANHQTMASSFHRSSEFCGSCHDVSNPVTGDLAHNFGAALPLPAGSYSGVPGTPVATKAAFNNPPYRYGTFERTFSEHVASAFPTLKVSDYGTLPAELQAGSIAMARNAALQASNGQGVDYVSGTRHYSCQTCHMRAVYGQGCDKNPPYRTDLPLHDLTGGNTWMPDVLVYLDNMNKLVLGGGLNSDQLAALAAGKLRARQMLQDAAALEVAGNELKVINLTGHKLISGFPEGRRMWLNIKWYDQAGTLLREDGKYGSMTVTIDGNQVLVDTILDLAGTNTRIYESHGAITREWANQLIGLGVPASLPVSFDRVLGTVSYTLGNVAAQAPGTHHESLRVVLLNSVVKDNRIPPFGFRHDDALQRNCLPVPANQYGDPGPGGVYDHWDSLQLAPPAGAATATIDLLYQATSWEFVQFLHLANDGSIAHLANAGADLLDAWLNTGMATPEIMASTTWTAPPPPREFGIADLTSLGRDALGNPVVRKTFNAGDGVGLRVRVEDTNGAPVADVALTIEIRSRFAELPLATLTTTSDAAGEALVVWRSKQGMRSGRYRAIIAAAVRSGDFFLGELGVMSHDFELR